jgi:hypothetical protein
VSSDQLRWALPVREAIFGLIQALIDGTHLETDGLLDATFANHALVAVNFEESFRAVKNNEMIPPRVPDDGTSPMESQTDPLPILHPP